MRAQEVLDFVRNKSLTEASASTYMKMFPFLQNLSPQDFETKGPAHPNKPYTKGLRLGQWLDNVTKEIEWARRILKKDERIVWYLRFYRLLVLYQIEDRGPIYTEMYNKEIRNMTKRFGRSEERLVDYADEVSGKGFHDTMNHFFSLPILSIQNFQFGNKIPSDIYQGLGAIEQKWRETRKGTVPDNPDAIPLIDFKNGWVWFNLNVADCSLEANAMGHCGNMAEPDSDDTLLSLRKLVMSEGERLWEPHLTFVLNERSGYLGEMKGRNNDKPVPAYHGMIIELLKLPIIKGIIGGGYEAHKNFMLSDLPKEVKENLITEHPKLLTPYDRYLKNGRNMSQDILEQTTEIMEASGFIDAMVKYDTVQKAFAMDRDKNMEMFLDIHVKEARNSTGVAKYYLKVLTGDEYLEFYDINVSDSEVEDFLSSVKNDSVMNDITNYIHKEYKDVILLYKKEDEDYDENDWRNIIEIITTENDSIEEAVKYAIQDGYASGTEIEMYNKLTEFLSNLELDIEDTNISFNLLAKYEDWHSTVTLMMPEDELLSFVSSGYYSEETWNAIRGEGFEDIEELHHSVMEYDEGTALERFNDLVYEHSDVSYKDEDTESKNPIDISRQRA